MRAFEEIYTDYDKAVADKKKYYEEDKRIETETIKLIKEHAVPPDFGKDDEDYQRKLRNLREQDYHNYDMYKDACDRYEKAADELLNAVGGGELL